MNKSTDDYLNILRNKSDKFLNKIPSDIKKMSTDDIESVLHELRVHQIELEIKASELRDQIKKVGKLEITDEHKLAKKTLRKSESKFRAVFELSPVPFALNDEQQNITYLNDAFVKTFGYNLEDIPTLTDWCPKAYPDAEYRQWVVNTWQAHLDKAKQTGLPFESIELTITCKNGIKRTVIASAVSLLETLKETHLIILYDISERKKVERLLLQSQKLEAVGLLAGGIAHDFNNILMGIFGNISLAKLEIPDDNPALKYLEESELSLERATYLTSQLLTFASGGLPVLENINLKDLIESTMRFDLLGSNVKLLFEYADDLWMAKVDKGQIEQVFSNLSINAKQAMSNGGALHIKLENTNIQENTIPNLCKGLYIKITVRDEGTGIDPNHLERIYEPFFSTKYMGIGLGLATVYSIVKKHGGCIDVDSQLDKGTTFTIYLPALESTRFSDAKPTDVKPTEALEYSDKQTTGRILVMDDDDQICNYLSQLLKEYGFSVSTTFDGEHAIEIYTQSLNERNPFELIITDLTIPDGMGGIEAVKEFININSEVKCIVSSGYANDPILQNYAEYGFKGILCKPYTPDKLREILSKVL